MKTSTNTMKLQLVKYLVDIWKIDNISFNNVVFEICAPNFVIAISFWFGILIFLK